VSTSIIRSNALAIVLDANIHHRFEVKVMKALLCVASGKPEDLVLSDIPEPSVGPDEVLIEVKACGVNYPDVLLVQGLYQNKPPHPFAPGGEIAGIVCATGSEASRFKVGDAVFASIGWGGMAERVAVPESACFPLPPNLDPIVAASFLVTYGTALHGLRDRARIQPGETLVVLGAGGGLGIAAVELGRLLGARVVAGVSSPEKRELVLAHGAEAAFEYPSGPLSRDQMRALSNEIKSMTDGKGADVVFDPVGGDYAEPAVRAMAWEGRYLVLGFTAGIPQIPLNLVLLKGCAILGVYFGTYKKVMRENYLAAVSDLVEWLVTDKLKPCISSIVPLEKGADAIRVLMDRKALGKLVVTVSQSI
jgi:NADPH:quinone reductase